MNFLWAELIVISLVKRLVRPLLAPLFPDAPKDRRFRWHGRSGDSGLLVFFG